MSPPHSCTTLRRPFQFHSNMPHIELARKRRRMYSPKNPLEDSSYNGVDEDYVEDMALVRVTLISLVGAKRLSIKVVDIHPQPADFPAPDLWHRLTLLDFKRSGDSTMPAAAAANTEALTGGSNTKWYPHLKIWVTVAHCLICAASSPSKHCRFTLRDGEARVIIVRCNARNAKFQW